MVPDSYFNLTNKSNRIDRLSYDLIRFFDHLVETYFFGHPVDSVSGWLVVMRTYLYYFPLSLSLSLFTCVAEREHDYLCNWGCLQIF